MPERIIVVNKLSPGDVIVLSAAIRDISLAYPGRFAFMPKTSTPAVWTHNPYISSFPESGAKSYVANYPLIKQSNQNRLHFIWGFLDDLNKKLGVSAPLTELRPDLHISPYEIAHPPAVQKPYWVLVSGGKTDFTAKWWNPASWQTVVDRLSPARTIVQVGGHTHVHPKLTGVVDLVGKTNMRELMQLIYHSEGVLCIVTCLAHIAAAFNKPCVTANTMITTSNGLSSVSQLVGTPFIALVDGKLAMSTTGFWCTGTKQIIRLTFRSGRQMDVTPDHELLTTAGWRQAGQIGIGESVVLHNHRAFKGKVDIGSRDYAKGYLLGNYVGDGTTSRHSAVVSWFAKDRFEYRDDGFRLAEQAGWRYRSKKSEGDGCRVGFQLPELYAFAVEKGCSVSGKKALPYSAVSGSWSYLAGLIAGYFDADGTVTLTNDHGMSIRLHSAQPENLRSVQLALAAFGILSKFYNGHKGGLIPICIKGKPDKLCNCKPGYMLHIAGDSVERFLACIKLRHKEKQRRIEDIVAARRRGPTVGRFCDRLMSTENIGEQPVFDCSVPGPDAFDANSVYAHNCVSVAGGREPYWWEAYTAETRALSMRRNRPAWVPPADDYLDQHYLHTMNKLPCCVGKGCWATHVGNRPRRCSNQVKVGLLDLPKCMTLITPDDVVGAVQSYFDEPLTRKTRPLLDRTPASVHLIGNPTLLPEQKFAGRRTLPTMTKVALGAKPVARNNVGRLECFAATADVAARWTADGLPVTTGSPAERRAKILKTDAEWVLWASVGAAPGGRQWVAQMRTELTADAVGFIGWKPFRQEYETKLSAAPWFEAKRWEPGTLGPRVHTMIGNTFVIKTKVFKDIFASLVPDTDETAAIAVGEYCRRKGIRRRNAGIWLSPR